ncbi:MAG: SIS domain-containing protein [Methanomassiliicoccales archaeon]
MQRASKIVEEIRQDRKTFIYGVGRSGLVGKAFAIRLVQMGLPVFFIGETITPIVENNDLTIVISNTGETMSAVQTANIVRRIGGYVICITGRAHSKLAHASSFVIPLDINIAPASRKVAPLGTIFEDAVHLLFDALVPQLMEKFGQNENSMRARHAIWV